MSLLIDSVNYTTLFAHDGADRVVTTTYPTNEVVSSGYTGRGLPYSVSGSVAGSLVSSVLHNNLSLPTEINLGNGLKSNFGYWGYSGTYDNSGGYYGRLYRIRTALGQNNPLQEVTHTWDAGGNLTQRQSLVTPGQPPTETESFSYDFLDRLTGASGPYTESYAYNQIGNITSKNGTSYTYGSKPHAVTAVGGTSYAYDANGNTLTGGSRTITWDAENRPASIVKDGTTTTFVYDGDGRRGKKTVSGTTTLYVNKYYEKNVATGEVTTYYHLGDRLVAMRKGATLSYIHQDHLTGTALTTDYTGNQAGAIRYKPYGESRSPTGTLPEQKFTGQRLDSSTQLYYYNARYYDPQIGRFISADTFVQSATGFHAVAPALTVNAIPMGLGKALAPQGVYPKVGATAPVNPQALNRYSYVLNSPLRYTDPEGWWTMGFGLTVSFGAGGGLTFAIHFVVDTNGGIGFVWSGGGWGGGMVGASLSTQREVTTANRIEDLAGWSLTVGGSGTVGPTTPETLCILNAGGSAGLEGILGLGENPYIGGNLNMGGGVNVPTPFEVHASVERSSVLRVWHPFGERERTEPASSAARATAGKQVSDDLPREEDGAP